MGINAVSSDSLLRLVQSAHEVVEYSRDRRLRPNHLYVEHARYNQQHIHNAWSRLIADLHNPDHSQVTQELQHIDTLTTSLLQTTTKESNAPLRRTHRRYHDQYAALQAAVEESSLSFLD